MKIHETDPFVKQETFQRSTAHKTLRPMRKKPHMAATRHVYKTRAGGRMMRGNKPLRQSLKKQAYLKALKHISTPET